MTEQPLRAKQHSTPPWSKEQVDALNAYQQRGDFHPYTCPNRGVPTHNSHSVLVATEAGWFCPHCDYTQEWAHDFSFNPPPGPFDTQQWTPRRGEFGGEPL